MLQESFLGLFEVVVEKIVGLESLRDVFCSLTVMSSAEVVLARFSTTVQKVEEGTASWGETYKINTACLGPLVVLLEVFEKRKLRKAVCLGSGRLQVSGSGPFGTPVDLPLASPEPTTKGCTATLKPLFTPTTEKLAENTTSRSFTQKKNQIIDKYDGLKDKLRPKYPVYRYEDLVGHLDTGDVILFHGIEAHSKLIEAGCLAYWSHACIIIRSPPDEVKELFGVKDYDEILKNAGTLISDPLKEDVYVFESDYMTIDLRHKGGCQLVPLKAWMIDYENYYSRMHCVIRRLIVPGRKHIMDQDFPNLVNWIKETAEKVYKESTIQCVKAVGKLNRREDLNSIFCSELVAATLKNMDLISPDLNCSNVTPKDFDKTTYQHKIHIHHLGKDDFELLKGSSLMDPVRIVYNLSKYTQRVVDRVKESPPIQIKQE